MFQKLSSALRSLFSFTMAKPDKVATREDSVSFLKRVKNSMEQDFAKLEIDFQPAKLDLSPLALPPEGELNAEAEDIKAPEKTTQPKKTQPTRSRAKKKTTDANDSND